jgi:hypothetical protein
MPKITVIKEIGKFEELLSQLSKPASSTQEQKPDCAARFWTAQRQTKHTQRSV